MDINSSIPIYSYILRREYKEMYYVNRKITCLYSFFDTE